MEFFFRDLKTKQLYTFDNVPQNTDVEICIGGLGITPGYLNNPELMSANFIAHPKDPKQKLFVPGDVVTLDKGMIYYVKRLSNFVKIAGQHVSPTEVETVTARLGFPDKPKFAQVAVTSFEYKHCSDNQLVCYYTLNSGETITLSGLRTHLAQLPAYSIPSLFVPLRKLPVGTNDKIARDQLPPPHALTEILRDDKPTEPTSALEAQLRKICAALIGINETLIGVKDHLSDVGLTSLLALSLITILKRDEKNGGYNVKISSQELIKHPTIEKLASLIQAKKATAAINEINSTGTAPAIWVVHDITGKTDYFRPTALLGERQIFGLDATPCGESLEAMAHAQIAAMRSKQPRGPYHIVAYSSGTALAKTIALILENQEEIIASLTFLDAPAPTVLKAQSTADYATHLHSVVEKLLVILQYKYNQYLITLPSIDDTKKQDTHANQIKFLFGHLKIRKTESNEKQSEKEPTELLVKQEADLLNDLNIIKNIFLAMEGEEPLKGQKLKCKITLFYTDALSQQYPTFEPHFGWDESCPQMDHRKIPKSDHATIVSAADQIGEWQKRISELTYEAYSPNTSDFSKLVTTLSSQLDQLSSAAKLANDHGSSSAADAGSVNDTKSSFDSTSNAIAEKLEAMREMLRNFQTTRLGASGVKPKHLASGSTLPTSPRSSPGFRLPFFVSVDAKSSAASAAGAAAAASAAAVPHSMSAPVTPMAPPGTDVADAGGGVSPRVSSALPTSQSGPIIFNLPPVSTAGSIPALAPKTGAGAVPDPAAAAAAAALESMQPLAPPLPPPSFTGPT
jgi:thioesterase domain-containing protein/aryl carrier-like protein